MEPQQASFDTFGRWLVTRLRADLAPNDETPPPHLYQFFTALYEDMLVHPEAYFIPTEPFTPFFSRITLTPEETTQHEALKAARMRVRKVVFAYLRFLFDLRQIGKIDQPANNNDLFLPQSLFDALAAGAAKKIKSRNFLTALERSGLVIKAGDPVIATNMVYPGMPAELSAFSQACAQVKDFDFYLFRRCDLSVFSGKAMPEFTDALRMVPTPFQDQVIETDEKLHKLRFRREIFVDGGDMTYRLRYSNKKDQAVYWCRIQETFHPDLRHYLRWKLESEMTPRLFNRLEDLDPGLAKRVFDGLKSCAHCYGGNCMARTQVTWQGNTKDVCKEDGWNQIGYSRTDYETLWTVLGILNELAT